MYGRSDGMPNRKRRITKKRRVYSIADQHRASSTDLKPSWNEFIAFSRWRQQTFSRNIKIKRLPAENGGNKFMERFQHRQNCFPAAGLLGKRRMYDKMQEYFFCPYKPNEIYQVVSLCATCACSCVRLKLKRRLQLFPSLRPAKSFEIDIVDFPLQTKKKLRWQVLHLNNGQNLAAHQSLLQVKGDDVA